MERHCCQYGFHSYSVLLKIFYTILLCLGLQSAATASTAWITSQVQPNGSYSNPNDLSTPFQAAAEALVTFSVVSDTSQPSISAALQFINSENFHNTENLSRKIIVNTLYGSPVDAWITELSASVNEDGGFGELHGYQSTVLDTVYALNAILAANQYNSDTASYAVGFVIGAQASNGSWADGSNTNSVFVTAFTSYVLQKYRSVYQLETVLKSANNFLLSQQAADGSIGNHFESAYALLALAKWTPNTALYKSLHDYLVASRNADTSWDSDVYSTALAMQALYVADNINVSTIPNPALGEIDGVVTNALTGVAISGATVSVSGSSTLSTTTDYAGHFHLVNVNPGGVTASVSSTGYLAAQGTGQVASGGLLTFNYTLQPDPTPKPLSITGRVVNTTTNLPLAGVSVTMANTPSAAVSGQNGAFSLIGLNPGNYQLQFSQPNYLGSVVNLSASTGGTIDLGVIALTPFNPATDPLPTTGTIHGVFTDALTGQPLRGVQISLSGSVSQVLFTDINGSFTVLAATPGAVTIGAALSGYTPIVGQADVVAGQTLNFASKLAQSNAPGVVALYGQVIDGVTNLPLAGAIIAFLDINQSMQSAADGKYQFSGVPSGSHAVQINYPGYSSIQYTFVAPAGSSVNLGQTVLQPTQVIDSNQKPVITSVAPTSATVSSLYIYQVVASDPDQNPLTYGLANYPNGMEINSQTGRITWTATSQQLAQNQFTVVVSDGKGGITQQVNVVNVLPGAAQSYVITDLQTLTGLTVNSLVPNNYVLGNYFSGGAPNFVPASPPCPLTYFTGTGTTANALTALDRSAIQPYINTDVILDMGNPYASITVFPEIDHGPFPQEGIEYTVWGSDDPNAVFPTNWQLATLVAIYSHGFEDNAACVGQSETDDYAGMYTFGVSQYRYVRIRANSSISIFNTPDHTSWQTTGDDNGTAGWQSGDAEIDGVGGMVCDVSPAVRAGTSIMGVAGQSIQFNAAGPSNIRVYDWDLDGDNTIDMTGPSPTHVFYTAFDRDVTLIAVDDRGCVGVDKVHVTIDLGLAKPDLTVTNLDISKVQTDVATLALTGSVSLQVNNIGNASAPVPALVSVFLDNNANNTYEAGIDTPVGAATMPAGLVIAGNLTMIIPINGISSYRDQTLHVMVDSNNQVDERNETNNVAHSSSTCVDSNQSPLSDLTLSRLALLNANGTNPAQITVRVGNAGMAVAPAGGVVNFYQGEVVMGGNYLGSVTLDSISAGQIVDITLNNVPALVNGVDIIASVNDAGTINECNINNNKAQLPVLTQTVSGKIAIATDTNSYSPNSGVMIDDTVTNTSAVPGQYKKLITIEDQQGHVITGFGPDVTTVISGGGNAVGQNVWNTGAYIAGTYVVRAQLFSLFGNLLDSSSTTIDIAQSATQGAVATLRVITDKTLYNTTDNVQIENLVTNTSLSTIVPGSKVQLTGVNSAGTTVYSATIPVGDLLPGIQLSQNVSDLLVDRPEGTYTLTGILVNASGQQIAASQTTYLVQSNLTKTLTGTVEVQLPSVFQGDSELCTYNVTNAGMTSLASQGLNQMVVNLDSGTLAEQVTTNVALPRGGQQTLLRSVATKSFVPGNYACVLQAVINNVPNTLGFANFKVDPPPVIMEARAVLGGKGRLLVWLNTGCDSDCAYTQSQIDALTSYLHTILSKAGWSHTLVTTQSDFNREMHTGAYTLYVLFGTTPDLSDATLFELREAVNRGDGLLVANGGIEPKAPLGIKGESSGKADGVVILASVFYPGGQLVFTTPQEITATCIDTAVSLATYVELRDQDNPTCTQALTSYQYGQGKSIEAGFDLLRQALSSTDPAGFEAVLLSSLNQIQPTVIHPYDAAVIPLTVTVDNIGLATNGQALVTLPAGVSVVEAPGGVMQANVLTWSFDMAAGQSQSFVAWLRLTSGSTGLDFPFVVQSGVAPNLVDRASGVLHVNSEPTRTLQSIIDELSGLQDVSSNYQDTYDSMVRASKYIVQLDYVNAEKYLLEGTDPISRVTTDQGKQLRYAIDVVIWGNAQHLP